MSIKKVALKIINQPPKKQIATMHDIIIIELYSAKKKSAKPILEYSTLKPDTNSDSASGKSNGARFVSARILIRNIINSGKKGTIKKTKFWKATMLIKFMEPTHNKITIKISPKDTSYEIICDVDLNAPK